MASIYLGMIANAMAFTIVYPFGSLMVMKFGLASNRSATGLYVGCLGFSMMAGRTLFSPIWGSISDKYGRKKVFLLSTLSIGVFSITFGFSPNYWVALASRILIGSVNACSLVGKVLIAEYTNSDPSALSLVIMS